MPREFVCVVPEKSERSTSTLLYVVFPAVALIFRNFLQRSAKFLPRQGVGLCPVDSAPKVAGRRSCGNGTSEDSTAKARPFEHILGTPGMGIGWQPEMVFVASCGCGCSKIAQVGIEQVAARGPARPSGIRDAGFERRKRAGMSQKEMTVCRDQREIEPGEGLFRGIVLVPRHAPQVKAHTPSARGRVILPVGRLRCRRRGIGRGNCHQNFAMYGNNIAMP